MKLLVISSPVFFPEEAEIVNRLFHAGMTCLHLRKMEGTKADFAKLLAAIEPHFIDRIAIHQYHELAPVFGLKRLHFTEMARLKAEDDLFENLKRNQYTLSTSIHDLNTINSLSTLFSYTFFSPVFDSISKPGYKSTLSDDFRLEDATRKIPVIALGGIGAHHLKIIKRMNFDGAAILGALWENPTLAVEVFSQMNEQMKR